MLDKISQETSDKGIDFCLLFQHALFFISITCSVQKNKIKSNEITLQFISGKLSISK